MKLIVLVLALATAANALSTQKQWVQFKVNYAKRYQNVREEQLRFQNFKDNIQEIEEHNAKYEKGEVSYYLAVNQFADMSSEEFKTLLNSQIKTRPNLNITSRFVRDLQASVPESIDYREKGAVAPVRNQGIPQSCGACWAFSTTGTLEAHQFLKNNKLEVLSTQELIDCSVQYGNEGCGGGFPFYAFRYIHDHGICADSDYSYNAVYGSCQKTCTPVVNISGYNGIDKSEEEIKNAVGTIGPVSVALCADYHWQLYGGGVFDHDLCKGEYLNHAVVIVGYGAEDSKDFWLLKNSWGTTWGEDGYIRLVRGKKQCGIDQMATYPLL